MKKFVFTTFAAGLLIASSIGASFAESRGAALYQSAAVYCAPANGAQILGGFAGPNDMVCSGR